MILYHIKKCADQLIVFHGKDFINIFHGIWENFLSYFFHCRTIRNRIRTWKRNRLSFRKSRFHGCRLCRFHTNHPDFRIQHFCKSRYTGDQTSSANRSKNIIHSRKFLNDLHCDRSLPCCNIKIIKRMHKC